MGFAGDGLHPDTLSTVSALNGVEIVDMSGDDYAYWDAISERWDGTDDLLIIEQDIVIHGGVLPQLRDCPGDWCVFPYPIFGGERLTQGLGCTRFSAALQRKVPVTDFETNGRLLQLDIPVGPGVLLDGIERRFPWPFLDVIIATRLRTGYGLAPHVHSPDVEHRHGYADEEIR